MADSWSVRGRRCIVTGATNGIGAATAEGLAREGARVVVVARNREKGEATVERLRAAHGEPSAELLMCDFASQRSIRNAAAEALERFPQIHVLVNNHGVVGHRRTLTEDGVEATFAVNHLGYFLFTTLLVERLVASAPARIVNVASDAHKFAAIDFDDLQSERGYASLRVYGRSKGCNLLFNLELARRLEGTGVTVNALHPGGVNTGLGDAPGGLLDIVRSVVMRFMKSPEQGAETSLYLATSPEVDGVTGGYFSRRKPHGSTRQVRDPDLAARLWAESEALVAKSA